MAKLLGASQDTLAQAFLLLLRVGPVISFMPALGERVVPARVKLALALCFVMALLPIIPVVPSGAEAKPITLKTALVETIIGLFLGVALRMFVIALQTAGSMAAQATSLAQLFAGTAAEPMPAIGHFLVVGGLALAMIMGLPLRVLELLVHSYSAAPLGATITPGLLADWMVKLVANSFALAFTLAAPFLIMSLLYNLTLGVINRAMPQLMVAFVGAPVITAGGLLFLFLFGGIMLSVWWRAFETYLLRSNGLF